MRKTLRARGRSRIGCPTTPKLPKPAAWGPPHTETTSESWTSLAPRVLAATGSRRVRASEGLSGGGFSPSAYAAPPEPETPVAWRRRHLQEISHRSQARSRAARDITRRTSLMMMKTHLQQRKTSASCTTVRVAGCSISASKASRPAGPMGLKAKPSPRSVRFPRRLIVSAMAPAVPTPPSCRLRIRKVRFLCKASAKAVAPASPTEFASSLSSRSVALLARPSARSAAEAGRRPQLAKHERITLFHQASAMSVVVSKLQALLAWHHKCLQENIWQKPGLATSKARHSTIPFRPRQPGRVGGQLEQS